MSKGESIESLMAKYNRLCARYRDLEQQTTEKQEKWQELERAFRTNESLTRELCELILARDPKEMVLGEEYAWGKLPTRDIIQKSKSAFANYNEARTKLLRDIQRQSEERRVMIENLQTQIEADRRARERLEELRGPSEAEVAYDETTGEIIEAPSLSPSEPQTSPGIDEKTKKRMAYSVQQAAENGSISVVPMDDDDAAPAVSPISSLHITEEKGDITSKDIEQQKDMAARAVVVDLERSGTKITQAEKKVRAAQVAKNQTKGQIVQVNIGSIEKNMNSRRWAILEIIGTTGLCEGGEIVSAAISLQQERKDENIITENGMRHELMQMVTSGCLTMETNVNHPIKSKFYVYTLSEVGQALYIGHFGKDPVVSERDMLIAQHDNLEHGFGIKCLKKILEDSDTYFDVSMDRRKNTIKLDSGDFYIPDIMAKIKGRQGNITIYMEYERGTHHQSDFNIKLNKMAKVTRHIDIVCPNNKTADFLRDKTVEWVKSRGGAKSLPGVKVRITTLTKLNGQKNIIRDDNWRIVFDLRHGEVPIERT